MALLGRAWGFDAWDAWLSAHLGLHFPTPTAPSGFHGNVFLHPGAGRVLGIGGWAEAIAAPDVVSAVLEVKQGDVLTARMGTGESVARLDLAHPDPLVLRNRLRDLPHSIRFEIGP